MNNQQNKQCIKTRNPQIKEPHLLDIGNLQEIAQWLALFILGLIGDTLYDMTKDAVKDTLNSIKRRFGKSRIKELEAKVAEFIADEETRSRLSSNEIKARINEIFNDFR